MKKAKNFTLNSALLDKAKLLMELRHFSNLTGLIEQLIREEFERRHGPAVFPGSAAPIERPPLPPHKIEKYSFGKHKPKVTT